MLVVSTQCELLMVYFTVTIHGMHRKWRSICSTTVDSIWACLKMGYIAIAPKNIAMLIDQWIWGCLGTPFSDKPHVWGLGYAEQSMDTTHISKSATNDDLTILEGKSQNL